MENKDINKKTKHYLHLVSEKNKTRLLLNLDKPRFYEENLRIEYLKQKGCLKSTIFVKANDIYMVSQCKEKTGLTLAETGLPPL